MLPKESKFCLRKSSVFWNVIKSFFSVWNKWNVYLPKRSFDCWDMFRITSYLPMVQSTLRQLNSSRVNPFVNEIHTREISDDLVKKFLCDVLMSPPGAEISKILGNSFVLSENPLQCLSWIELSRTMPDVSSPLPRISRWSQEFTTFQKIHSNLWVSKISILSPVNLKQSRKITDEARKSIWMNSDK